MPRIVSSFVLALGLAVAYAAAQANPGQDVLLRALARYNQTEVRNLEREQRNVFYGQDSEQPTMELRWRSLIDFENQRLLSEDYASGNVVKRTSYVDGQALILDLASGDLSEMGDEEHRFGAILARDPTWPARGLIDAVYQGRMRYADLVEGEQYGVPGDDYGYLFSDGGRLVARVLQGTPGNAPTELRLYEDERRVSGIWFPFLTRDFELEGEQATLVQEIHVLELVVNQTLDDARFDLGAEVETAD